MTTMNDFIKTNDVDDILASVINNLQPSILRSQFNNAESLSATRTLADTDTPIQRLNCNGANRTVKMPTANTTDNHPYFIVNSTSSGTYTLTVQNNGATETFATLRPGEYIFMLPDGNGGYKPVMRQTDVSYIGRKRLSLESAVMFSSSDQTAKTTVYWTDGNTNLSVSVPATTTTPFDIYYSISGNSLSTVNWTNDTTRATALAYDTNGVVVKSGDTNFLYLGTGRTTGSSGQTEDSYNKRYLFNWYNQVLRPVRVLDSTNTWTYSTNSWRQANAATTNQVEIMNGFVRSGISLRAFGSASNSGAGCFPRCAIGEDSTTTPHTSCSRDTSASASAGAQGFATSSLATFPAVGYHYYAWLERDGTGAGTTTWLGDNGSDVVQNGIMGEWTC